MNQKLLQIIVLTGLFLPIASANVYAGCETEKDVKLHPKCCISCHEKELKDFNKCDSLSGNEAKICENKVQKELKTCQDKCK